jgi:hypothetical protein
MSTRYSGGLITKTPVSPVGPLATGAASGVWTIDQATQFIKANSWPNAGYIPPGQQAYTTPGTYSWVCPAGVTSVSVVCVGPGGQGSGYDSQGSGGGLGWKNNIPVVPGNSYTVFIGTIPPYAFSFIQSGDSYFISPSTVKGGGGQNAGANGATSVGGSYVGDGGGNGGSSFMGASYAGGGGAAGYTGGGGDGGRGTYDTTTSTAGQSGSGGGGGGGSGGRAVGGGGWSGGSGGGVGLLGQGANGTGAPSAPTGSASTGSPGSPGSGGVGMAYGGGASANNNVNGTGAVRIIYGTGRSFPSTNTGNI